MNIITVLVVLFGLCVGWLSWIWTTWWIAIPVGIAAGVAAHFGMLILAEIWLGDELEVSRVSHWLAHPLEFGRPPDSCEIVFKAAIRWPLDGDATFVYLCRFEYRNEDEVRTGVALAGPTHFSFIDSLDVPYEELMRYYRGWYVMIAFHASGADDDMTSSEWQMLIQRLRRAKYEFDAAESPESQSQFQTVRSPANELLFSLLAKKDGREVIVLGDALSEHVFVEYDAKISVEMAHYRWLNDWWVERLGIDPKIVSIPVEPATERT